MMNAASATAASISSTMIHKPLSNTLASIARGSRAPLLIVAALLLAACGTTGPQQPPAATQTCNCEKPVEPPAVKPGWKRADYAHLPGWSADQQAEAWRAFLASCRSLRRQSAWQAVCADAERADPATARAFFETRLAPWIRDAAPGTITGYYEPLLTGSRTRKAPYLYPVYATPDDLLIIDLGDVRPDLKGQRLRGRLDGRRVVPYYSRAEIDGEGTRPGQATSRPLLYVDDPIDLFFLMIQGSGRVQLDSGETVHVNFADQNGHPYHSIGRYLVDKGEMKLEQASMQGIKAWARANPARLTELLNTNPSYVFFRESRATDEGPQGAIGAALTAGRSLAVDPAYTPLGAPVWLVTTRPNTSDPLQRLMLAQDTGGAIRGANRADYFWGFGEDAAREAGRMKQTGELYVLWPNEAGEPPK